MVLTPLILLITTRIFGGGGGGDIPILRPDTLRAEEDKNALRIIITPYLPPHRADIQAQLEEMGLSGCIYRFHKTDLPAAARMESSTLCQLNCPDCYMRRNNSKSTGKGYLKFSDFKNFLYTNPFIKTIELSFYGEMFLNPDLADIIRYAYEKGVRLTAYAGVNFNTVSDEVMEALVKYKFRGFAVAIDGASQEVYCVYRRNGDYNRVISNIERLNGYKAKCNSEYPVVSWQYVIMEHNEGDVIKAKKEAKRLNMDIFFKMPWGGYKPKNIEMLHRETGLTFENNSAPETRDIPNNTQMCSRMWLEPTVNWDGRLMCSCYSDVYNAENAFFGVNVFEVGLEKAMDSENYRYAQDMLLGKAPPPENPVNIPCAKCGNYESMRKSGVFLSFDG